VRLPDHSPGEVWVMFQFKNMATVIAVMLIVLAAAGSYVSAKDLMDLPAGYIDHGSYMYTAHKYDRSSRQVRRRQGKRMVTTTETIYLVRCKAPDAPCTYTIQKSNETAAKKLINEPFQTQRRVLQEKGGNGAYITVDPSETAESYLRGRKLKDWLILAASLLYFMGFGAFWFLRAKQEAQTTS